MLARDTGWPEHFIVWELPLSRALGYYHASLRSEGYWTVKRKAARLTGPIVPVGFFDFEEEEDE